MAVPLTTLPQRPVHNDVRRFGGDDTQLRQSGLFGTIAQWSVDANSNVFKVNFVFIMKQAFAFLDNIGIGTCIYGEEGIVGRISDYETEWSDRLEKLNLNRVAREQIIRALGGEGECERIPVVNFNERDLAASLYLGHEYLSAGQWIVQTEDSAGRKAIVMHLRDKTRQVYIATAYQRYRETSIEDDSEQWTLNFDSVYSGIVENTERVAEFIEKVRTNQHEQFSFVPKFLPLG